MNTTPGLPLNHPVILWCLAIAEGMVRHVWVKNSLKRVRRLMKVYKRLVFRPAIEEMNTVTAIREELIDLLENSKPVKDFFTNPCLPALIIGEEDIKGLDRLRIVFSYLDKASGWYAWFNEKSTISLQEPK